MMWQQFSRKSRQYVAAGRARWVRLIRWLRSRTDSGMATAEYAMATVAACGFAAVLLAILRSDQVKQMMLDIIKRALNMG